MVQYNLKVPEKEVWRIGSLPSPKWTAMRRYPSSCAVCLVSGKMGLEETHVTFSARLYTEEVVGVTLKMAGGGGRALHGVFCDPLVH